MIEKNDNILTNKHLGRIVTSSDEWRQITIGDMRFYEKNKEFYPSVSYILSFYPKGAGFESWLKEKGEEANSIAFKSAEAGTKIHKAIEQMLEGSEPKWIGDSGYVNYSFDEWLMILKFADFWNTHKPKLIKSEYHTFSNIHKYAGTIDLILEIKGKMWVVDIKTSNSLHTTYELQTSAYAKSWNEHHPDQKIDNTGILWLKASTRKPDSSGEKIQGRGWALKTFDRTYEESFDIFLKVYDIFKIETPVLKPLTEIYPNSIKLDLE